MPPLRIKEFNYFWSKDTVDNPSAETQVFIEVQFRGGYVYRSSSGVLFSPRCESGQVYSPPFVPHRQTRVRLFQINFDDLFAADIFRHCDINALLSVNISRNPLSTARFWNLFKRHTSEYGNRVGKKYAIKDKPRVAIINVKIEVLSIQEFDDVELKGSLKLPNQTEEENNEQSTLTQWSVMDDFMLEKYNDDEKKICAICLDTFEKGTDVMETLCGHEYHLKCFIPWFNKRHVCPLCRSYLI